MGQHPGAGDPDGATASGWRALRFAMGSMLLIGALIIVGARPMSAPARSRNS